MATIYDEVYRRALSDPERFWAVAAEDIHFRWSTRWNYTHISDDILPALWAAGVTEDQIEGETGGVMTQPVTMRIFSDYV